MSLTRHRHLESHLQDTLDLRTSIDICIIGLVVVLILLAKIHASRQLANHHEVSSTQEFILQWRLMQQTVEGSHRTDIGKKSELLAHSQQTRFRTDLRCGVIIIFQRTHSRKEHGIGTHTDLVGSVGIRIAHLFDGMRPTNGLLVFKLVSALRCNRIKHCHTLFHYLWSDTITSQNSNL